MKKGIFFIIVCTIANMVYAQQADTTIVFDKLMHDFGAIVQSDGQQSYSFEFTNKGSSPITIQKVIASCGCTTSDWTKAPVVPGAKGYIKATYNPSGIGSFNKSITVDIAGGMPQVIVLHIRGSVIEKI
jgi:hypothetical protein